MTIISDDNEKPLFANNVQLITLEDGMAQLIFLGPGRSAAPLTTNISQPQHRLVVVSSVVIPLKVAKDIAGALSRLEGMDRIAGKL